MCRRVLVGFFFCFISFQIGHVRACESPKYQSFPMKGDALLELRDPLHRYGHDLRLIAESIRLNRERNIRPEDRLTVEPKRIARVHYMAPEERSKFVLTFRDGKVQSRLYRENKAWTSIFVMDAYGTFYAATKHKASGSPYDTKSIQHSSFLAGQPVAGAGKFYFNRDGRLYRVLNYSGHYQPGTTMLKQVLCELMARGVEIESLPVVRYRGESEYSSDDQWSATLAKDFLSEGK